MSKENWNKLAESDAWIRASLDQMNEVEAYDAFYKSLEFGTAGMRGLLGAGPNRMNIYTVGKATRGFALYLCETFSESNRKVAIAYDNRHMSREFAEVSARILSTFGIRTYVFSQPRPTPELSFAVRQLGCVGGIVITASHNPKEYNGYKVYDETGCQLVDHKISRVISLINQHDDETTIDIKTANEVLIERVDESFDEQYKDAIKSIQLRPEGDKPLSIVFTSQHGTSYPLVPDILTELDYSVYTVMEQSSYDPNFSNTKTPNPEDHASFDKAVSYAKSLDADLVLSCDPDADRMGIVVKHDGDYIYLTGNQGGSILQEYVYSTHREFDTMPENPVMFNTIVTSDLGSRIADSYGVSVEKTLTGFKYIGEKIEHHNIKNDKEFIFGYEESYGYLLSDFVRDKDALQACLMVAEAANHYKLQGKTLVDVLNELYLKFGFYYETQVAVTLAGVEGLSKIKDILNTFRTEPLEIIAGMPVVLCEDFLTLKDSFGNDLDYPSSNVLKYTLEDGSWIAIRPSGTEPKCKFYYCIVGETIHDAKIKFESYHQEIMRISKID